MKCMCTIKIIVVEFSNYLSLLKQTHELNAYIYIYIIFMYIYTHSVNLRTYNTINKLQYCCKIAYDY